MDRLPIAVVLPLLIACGDNLELPLPAPSCEEISEDPFGICRDVAGPIESDLGHVTTDEFDLSTCDPASLDGVDLSGTYRSMAGDFALAACADGYQLRGFNSANSFFRTSLYRDANGLLLHSESPFSSNSLLICGINDDGSLAARRGGCNAQNGCGDFETTVQPLVVERPNGEAESRGLELVAEHNLDVCGREWPRSQFVSHVEVDGDEAFVTVAASGLHIVDVSDPRSPETVATVQENESFYNDIVLFRVDGRRYVVLAGGEMPILDVTDPLRPTEVARIKSPAHRFDLKQTENDVFLYVVGAGLEIYDLSDPSEPRSLGSVLDGAPDLHAPVISGDKLYVAGGSSGFFVMDDPAPSPNEQVVHGIYTETGFQYIHHAAIFEVGEVTYALHNDEVGTESWFKILDVTPGSPSFLQVQSEYLTLEGQASHNITIKGSSAYLAYYEHGARVLDISDPRNPLEQAYFHTFSADNATFYFDGVSDIALAADSDLIFASVTPRGLMILRPD